MCADIFQGEGKCICSFSVVTFHLNSFLISQKVLLEQRKIVTQTEISKKNNEKPLTEIIYIYHGWYCVAG